MVKARHDKMYMAKCQQLLETLQSQSLVESEKQTLIEE